MKYVKMAHLYELCNNTYNRFSRIHVDTKEYGLVRITKQPVLNSKDFKYTGEYYYEIRFVDASTEIKEKLAKMDSRIKGVEEKHSKPYVTLSVNDFMSFIRKYL